MSFLKWRNIRHQSNTDIFISHAHADHEIAFALIKIIENTFGSAIKIKCTSSLRHTINSGNHIESDLRESIIHAKLLIGLVTKNSIRSYFVQNELGGAWILKKPWLLFYYEDDVISTYNSFISNYQITSLYEKINIKYLIESVNQHIGLKDVKTDFPEIEFDSLRNILDKKYCQNNKHLKPFQNEDSDLKEVFNKIFFREYVKAFDQIKSIPGQDNIYRLLHDFIVVKYLSPNFRMNKTEEDFERIKLLRLIENKI